MILSTERIGIVVVTDGPDLAGILSERDIIRAIRVHGASALALQTDAVMTKGVVSCGVNDSLADVLAEMSRNTIRHMPVMDDGKVIGLISVRDVLDFQQHMLKADIARRMEDAKALEEAHSNLEKAFEART